MAQALHLINGAGVNQKISSDSGMVARLLKSNMPDAKIIEELYLTCFGRMPTAPESKAALQMVQEAQQPKPEPVKPAEAPKPAVDPKAPVAAAADAKPAEAAKPADAKPAEGEKPAAPAQGEQPAQPAQ